MLRTLLHLLACGLLIVAIFSYYVHESITDHNTGQEQSWTLPANKLRHYFDQQTILRKISVLTFNVHGLPNTQELTCDNLIKIGKKLGEMRRQGNAPTIVAIQEGFHEKIKDLVVLSGYPYVQEGPTGDAKEMTSGLWILSEFPITKKKTTIFSSCVSWDCLSNKGIEYVTVEVPANNGKTISLEIFNTHMNAYLNGGDIFTEDTSLNRAKKDQIKEFHDFVVKTHNPSTFGSLLVGDFNFKYGDVFYDYFERLFDFKNPSSLLGGVYDFLLNGHKFPRTVDYQFFYKNKNNIRPLSFKKIFDKTYSDHLGLMVEYQISQQ